MLHACPQFYDETRCLLPSLMQLLRSFMERSHQSLAAVGVAAFVRLCNKAGGWKAAQGACSSLGSPTAALYPCSLSLQHLCNLSLQRPSSTVHFSMVLPSVWFGKPPHTNMYLLLPAPMLFCIHDEYFYLQPLGPHLWLILNLAPNTNASQQL